MLPGSVTTQPAHHEESFDSGTPTASLRWSRLVRVPVVADEAEGQIARLVHVLGLSIFVAAMVAMLHNVYAGQFGSALLLGSEQMLMVLALWLNHRQSSRTAARLIGISLMVLVPGLQILGNRGVHDVASLVYPGVIVLSGALLDRRWFLYTVALAMTALGTQYLLELTQVVTTPLSAFTDWRQLADAQLILIVTALSVQLLMRSLRESMATSRQAFLALRESEARYRMLFESVSEALMLHEPSTGAIIDANQQAMVLFGPRQKDLRGLALAELLPGLPPFAPPSKNTDSSEHATLREWQARAQDGREFWVELDQKTASVNGRSLVLTSVRDIDERKRRALEQQRLEAQVHQAQKMESIGRLAGGVAHDFNNILTAIGSNTELALLSAGDQPGFAQRMRDIEDAVRRASDLTRRLLAFSRNQPIEPRPLELGHLLEESARMLNRLVGDAIELQIDVSADVQTILADPNQIEQIVMNLVVNARDAMREPGTIRIEVTNQAHPTDPNRGFVRLRVSDQGGGIAPELLPQIFDPFFTTKPSGKGTGLGLSMVLGAVQQNQGLVEVSSEMGRGSTFDVFLPVLEGMQLPIPPHAIEIRVTPGQERLLLVEDDDAVRSSVCQLLAHLGYRVTACASSAEAISRVEIDRQSFELLVSDVILPGLDGKALADRLRETLPSLKVLFCSGYTADIIAQSGVIDSRFPFLAKPYTINELNAKIRSVLDQEPLATGQ